MVKSNVLTGLKGHYKDKYDEKNVLLFDEEASWSMIVRWESNYTPFVGMTEHMTEHVNSQTREVRASLRKKKTGTHNIARSKPRPMAIRRSLPQITHVRIVKMTSQIESALRWYGGGW